jgi:hypothetical protein
MMPPWNQPPGPGVTVSLRTRAPPPPPSPPSPSKGPFATSASVPSGSEALWQAGRPLHARAKCEWGPPLAVTSGGRHSQRVAAPTRIWSEAREPGTHVPRRPRAAPWGDSERPPRQASRSRSPGLTDRTGQLPVAGPRVAGSGRAPGPGPPTRSRHQDHAPESDSDAPCKPVQVS